MRGDSFQFGKYNSVEDWRIKCIAYDYLLPPKRPRKITIPGRSGTYDFGSRIYNERELRLTCMLTRTISKAQLREIAYALSEKKKLIIWNEPDKYYMAELYDATEVIDFPGETMREFELNFVCEPFAYQEPKEIPLHQGVNPISYAGTASTPCRIIIENTNSYPISNLVITAVKRG